METAGALMRDAETDPARSKASRYPQPRSLARIQALVRVFPAPTLRRPRQCEGRELNVATDRKARSSAGACFPMYFALHSKTMAILVISITASRDLRHRKLPADRPESPPVY
jgi:hypothetical protein